MKALKAIAKIFIVGLGFLSLVAIAETYYDKQFYTANFMDEVEEVKLNLPIPNEKRIVASFEKKLPLVQEVPLSMSSLVDGKWEIKRVINEEGRVAYDAIRNPKASSVVVEVKLISLSTVRIDNDVEQTFKISLLTEEGTIALFKIFGEGYEIVEAVRVKSSVNVEDEVLKEEVVEQKKSKYDIEEDLFLVSALDPKKNRNVLRSQDVEGYAYLKNGELILENIKLHVGTKNQTESVSTEARIMDHGTFSDGRGTQGIVTNISNDEIKVRFSTGPLAGAMLNFVTYEKKGSIEEKFGAAPERQAVEVQDSPAAVNAQIEKPEVYESSEPQPDLYKDDVVESNEDAVYEEVDGNRVNNAEEPLYEDGQAEDFEQMRKEMDNMGDRTPSSIEPEKVGFSF
ncbi:MAG: hypothetical protein K9K67_01990 [Bacteriovoracaceae bacterium]|nr:hypothetical protein [Bacteriovoracaceae bacterium]